MALKHRIEQLEKNRPPESNVIDEWLKKHAKPFENDEEKKEIERFIEQIGQDIRATTDYWDAQKEPGSAKQS